MGEMDPPEQDDDAEVNSALAADLIRLCPHLSPDLREPTETATSGGGFTVH